MFQLKPFWIVGLSGFLFFAGCGGDDQNNPGGSTGQDGGIGASQQTAANFLLEKAATAAEVATVIEQQLAQIDKNVSSEIKELVKTKLQSHGFSVQLYSLKMPVHTYAGETPEKYQLQYEPQDAADLLRMIGAEAIFRGNISVASWCFLQAARLKSDQVQILNDAAFALIQLEKYAEAKTLLLRAASLDKDVHSLYVNLAFIYRKLGKSRLALLAIQRAIAMQPKAITYRQVAVEIYQELGNNDGAYRQQEMIVRLDPQNSEAKTQLDQMPKPAQTPASSPSAAAAQLLVDLLQCESDVGLAYGKKIMEPGAKELAVDQEFQNKCGDNSDACTECHKKCNDEGCSAACEMAHCSADQATFAATVPKEVPLPFENETAYFGLYDAFINCATPYLMRETNAEVLEQGLQEVDRYYTELLYSINDFFVNSADLISIWHGNVKSTCDDAAQAIEDAKTAEAYSTVNNSLVLDLCLDKAVCIGINNSNIAVSGSVGIFNGKLSTDLATGAWGVSVGVGASDPTGTFQAGVSVKFHSTKGVGVGADVKIGGPVKVRLGKDFYAFEALK